MLPELRKYTLCRVIHSWGHTEIFGVAKMLFADLESAKKAVGRLAEAPPDEFLRTYITNVRRIIATEEEVQLSPIR